jgi:hypothetical protein
MHGTLITKDALSITEQKKEMDCTTPSLLFSIILSCNAEKCVLLFLQLDVLSLHEAK